MWGSYLPMLITNALNYCKYLVQKVNIIYDYKETRFLSEKSLYWGHFCSWIWTAQIPEKVYKPVEPDRASHKFLTNLINDENMQGMCVGVIGSTDRNLKHVTPSWSCTSQRQVQQWHAQDMLWVPRKRRISFSWRILKGFLKENGIWSEFWRKDRPS